MEKTGRTPSPPVQRRRVEEAFDRARRAKGGPRRTKVEPHIKWKRVDARSPIPLPSTVPGWRDAFSCTEFDGDFEKSRRPDQRTQQATTTLAFLVGPKRGVIIRTEFVEPTTWTMHLPSPEAPCTKEHRPSIHPASPSDVLAHVGTSAPECQVAQALLRVVLFPAV